MTAILANTSFGSPLKKKELSSSLSKGASELMLHRQSSAGTGERLKFSIYKFSSL